MENDMSTFTFTGNDDLLPAGAREALEQMPDDQVNAGSDSDSRWFKEQKNLLRLHRLRKPTKAEKLMMPGANAVVSTQRFPGYRNCTFLVLDRSIVGIPNTDKAIGYLLLTAKAIGVTVDYEAVVDPDKD